VAGQRRSRATSSSLETGQVKKGALQDFHQHKLLDGVDPFDLKYRLYSIVCHSGILGGGHYISYASNPNKKWYCYNDSSCREVDASFIDTTSAYMLFYQREGLDCQRYLPHVEGKIADTTDIDSDFESELKKICAIT